MAPPRINLSGQRFGRVTVVESAGVNMNGETIWLCKCDCGTVWTTRTDFLRSGGTRSCGCLGRENCKTASTKHGLTYSPEYRAWLAIKSRCYNTKLVNFSEYGGRGIKVCDRWLESFENFFLDMGSRPTPQHSIDRIDTNGNYEPTNCRWATRERQQRNRRDTKLFTFNGETLSLPDWAEKLGKSLHALRNRLRNGWSVEKTLSQPVESRKKRI